ncbi:MAG TPA: hypothetical protein ENK31_07325 [Nannocystis exedens]|nr:hypothetical protein [Nannocystis exedens]
MFSSGATQVQLAIGDFAKYERSCVDQALFLRNLQSRAVRERSSAVLCDPSGRVLAHANASGAVSLAEATLNELAALAQSAQSAQSNTTPVVVPEDGFYASVDATYYVSHGDVFELRSPELAPCSGFRKVASLPDDTQSLDVNEFNPSLATDAALFAYADAIDRIAELVHG